VTRGRSALLLALGAVWAPVPPLHLPHLDVRSYFDAAELRRADRFSRVEDLLWLGTTLVQLAVLGLWARGGARFRPGVRRGADGHPGMLLGMLGFALAIVMGLARARRIGDRWWLPAAPVFAGISLLFAFVSP